MTKRQEQINWIVNRFFDDDNQINLAASDMNLQGDFVVAFGEIGDRQWKDRIKGAAYECGLSGRRTIYDMCHAWTRWEIVYS